jgi:hypothetical protein
VHEEWKSLNTLHANSYSHTQCHIHIQSVLGRVRNCVGEQVLHCEMVACLSLTKVMQISMFRLHRDHTRGCVVAGVLHAESVRTGPHQGTALQYYS